MGIESPTLLGRRFRGFLPVVVDLETGRFTLDGLPEGAWTVMAHGWGGEDGRTVWRGEAQAAVGAEVEIVLKPQEQRPPR